MPFFANAKKNLVLVFFATVLFFLVALTSTASASCNEQDSNPYLSSLASFAQKILSSFGIDIALAEGTCPGTIIFNGCSGSNPSYTFSWPPAPLKYIAPSTTVGPDHYEFTLVGYFTVNTGLATSYTYAGFAQETYYTWQVEAYYPYCTVWAEEYCAGTACCVPSGLPNRPGSSFTTASCSAPANQPPSATNLSVNHSDFCSISGVYYFFSWQYADPDGDSESQFQFQVARDSSFNDLVVDRIVSGLSNPSPTVNNQTVNLAENPLEGQLGYGQVYFWRVRVWDSGWADSGWIAGLSFSTPSHAYPLIDFSWAPESPNAQETVQFADQSQVFGGAVKSGWLWNIQDATYISGTESTSQNPQIRFNSEGEKSVSLEVFDSDGFRCLASKNINVGIGFFLPRWREIAPW